MQRLVVKEAPLDLPLSPSISPGSDCRVAQTGVITSPSTDPTIISPNTLSWASSSPPPSTSNQRRSPRLQTLSNQPARRFLSISNSPPPTTNTLGPVDLSPPTNTLAPTDPSLPPINLNPNSSSPARRSPRLLLSARKKHRTSKHDVFKSRFEKVQKQYKKGYRKNYRKKASAVAKKRYYERADTAVCHILSILGYSSIDNIHRNQDIFDDVMDFVCTIKARVISRTQLMKDPVDRVETMTNEEINVSENDKKRLKCIESTLLQRLPRDDYNSLVKKINVDMIDGNKFDSYHILEKDLPSLLPLQTTYKH